jgi:hypothetical protein
MLVHEVAASAQWQLSCWELHNPIVRRHASDANDAAAKTSWDPLAFRTVTVLNAHFDNGDGNLSN